MTAGQSPSRTAAAAFLVGVTFLWGMTFLVMKLLLGATGPVALVAVRFLLATLLLAPLLGRALLALSRQELLGGFAIGLCVLACHALQCMGLKTVSSSTSALLTALYVPFTFVLMTLFFGEKPKAWNVLGSLVTFAGLLLLANPLTLTWSNAPGEWLTIGCALATACSIVVTSRFARACHPLRLTFVEMVTVALGASVLWAASGEGLPVPTPGYLVGIVALAAIAAFAQFGCARVQALVPADEAALLYTLEPVFAAIIGFAAGDRLGAFGTLGAALMLAGMAISQGWPYIRSRFFK